MAHTDDTAIRQYWFDTANMDRTGWYVIDVDWIIPPQAQHVDEQNDRYFADDISPKDLKITFVFWSDLIQICSHGFNWK